MGRVYICLPLTGPMAYSIDAEGHTTSTAYGRLAVVDGALAWDVAP